MKFVCTAIFSGNMPNVDVDRAVAELTKAGYTVVRLPEELRTTLDSPGDDFAEATFECPNEAVAECAFNEIGAIVAPYAGIYDDCGPMEPDHVPFAWFETGPAKLTA
jgi:hypothetical protein